MDRDDGASNGWMLGDFGITPHAERVWRCLLDKPQISRSQLIDETGHSEAELEASIGTLTTARLVRTAPSSVGVVAIDPHLAVEVHIVRAERELIDRANELATLRARLPDVAASFQRGRALAGDLPGFEVVASLDDVRRQIYLAAEQATTVTRAMVRNSSPAGLRHSEHSDQAALARGIRDLSLMSLTTFSDPEIYRFLQGAHERGERIRTLATVPTQMVLIDESLAVVPIDVRNTALGAIFVRVPSMIAILIEMFDHLWSEATPTFVVDGGADAPSGRCARVLELLAIGATDERIARTLTVGVRTVRREVADIKTMLGVSSRAEIAAAAIRRDWL